MSTTQLQRLAKPFPARYIKAPSAGKYGEYVEHSDITQALLDRVGPYDFRVRHVIRGVHGDLSDVVVAVVCALTVRIDGQTVTIEEVGDCENPTNWKNDGARLKDAMSDAIKRCAMRIGLGLHLWAQEDYFLDAALAAKETTDAES